MTSSIAAVVAVVLLLGAAAPIRAAEPLAALVARTIAAHGGDALPGRGTLMRQTGRNWSNRQQSAGEILRELSWPDYLRVDIAYADGTRESRVMLGQEGWRDGAPAPAPLVDAMRLQAARLALPMILEWEVSALSDMGQSRREDGRAVRRVALDLGGGLTLYVEIDAETALVLRSAGVMRMGSAEMEFGAVYGALRDFGTIRLPGREDQSAMGMETGWTEIETVETGLPFDRDALRP